MYACIYLNSLQEDRFDLLMQCANAFSPYVEAASDNVLIDIRGSGQLLGMLTISPVRLRVVRLNWGSMPASA
jgi:hypothetical protein